MTTHSDTRLDHLRAEVEFERTNYALGKAVDLDRLFEVFAEMVMDFHTDEELEKSVAEAVDDISKEAREEWKRAEKEESRADVAEREVSRLESDLEDAEERIAELEKEVERLERLT
mgnify:CR=1 FL=1